MKTNKKRIVLSALSLVLVFCLMAGSEFPGYILTHHYLPRLLCTVIPVPILYYFNRALGLFIREKE